MEPMYLSIKMCIRDSARYVKVYCIERATEYGFSLYELEVY